MPCNIYGFHGFMDFCMDSTSGIGGLSLGFPGTLGIFDIWNIWNIKHTFDHDIKFYFIINQ